jgi:RNA polymerase sigma-70 factor (ECF subfamily)
MISYSQSTPIRWLKLRMTGGRVQPETDDTLSRYPMDVEQQEQTVMDIQVKKIWKESFKGFYKKYSRALWFYILKTCRDEALADDIFQDAFYRFLRAEPIRFNEYQQKAYLYKIATNLIIDHMRKNKRKLERETEPEPYGEQGFEESTQDREFLAMDMEKLFKLLKPKERTLLWLAYVEGYSHKEISRITGINEKSIKVKMFRARKRFAVILEQKGYQPGIGRSDHE